MVKDNRVYSFGQLAQKLQSARDGKVKLAYNTVAHFSDNDKIGIRLHWTDVIIVNADDTYQLYSGGYTTRTTADRLNGFSPAKVIQKDFSFYLLKNPSDGKVKSNLIHFKEGIKVNRFGCIIE
ncbi:MAG TPA: hypothetical protein VFD03_10080 [Clostridia bacterium]|nr:hypothetical protein [Clostridia bacterium]